MSAHMHIHEISAQTTKRLALSLGLTFAFVFIEILAGLWSNSLALLTDAAHNFTDVIALGLSGYALKISTQPANAGKTYGYHRVGILAALINSTTLILIAGWIFFEAYRRVILPPQVDAPILIGVGTLAFFVNLITAWLVHKGSESDLNLRSAFIHLMGDVISTLGAVIAGVIIFFTQWNWLDPLVSILIGVFILYTASGILRQSIHILLESAPENLDIPAMLATLRNMDGVLDIHDLHVWSVNQNLRMFSAHIVMDDIPISACMKIQENINQVLAQKYNIHHATLQVECEGCKHSLLFCDIHEHQHI